MKSLLRITLSMFLAAYAAGAVAQRSQRAGTWEFTLQPQYTNSTRISSGDGSSADIDSTLGFGMGFAYNLNNHFSLGGEFVWSQADYKATVTPASGNPNNSFSITGTLYTSTIRMNATWNILASDLTPIVVGGLGSTYVDTSIPNGPPNNYCWWDPWWGYYCGTYVPTKTSTNFSYMAGAGVRWDANRSFFVRGLVDREWIDAGGDLGTPWVDQYRIDFGFKF